MKNFIKGVITTIIVFTIFYFIFNGGYETARIYEVNGDEIIVELEDGNLYDFQSKGNEYIGEYIKVKMYSTVVHNEFYVARENDYIMSVKY